MTTSLTEAGRQIAAEMRRSDGVRDFNHDAERYRNAVTNWLNTCGDDGEAVYRFEWHSLSCVCRDCLTTDYIFDKYATDEPEMVSFDRT